MATSLAPKRDLKKIKYFTIHHSAVNPGAKNLSELKTRAKQYDNSHSIKDYDGNGTNDAQYTGGELGYKWILYHHMIARDGSTLALQKPEYRRYHAGDSGRGANSHNEWGIAILLDGNFEIEKPTEAQLLSSARIIYKHEKAYKISTIVRGHKETALPSSPTACPGKYMGVSTDAKSRLRYIIDLVNQMHKNGGLTDAEKKAQTPPVVTPPTTPPVVPPSEPTTPPSVPTPVDPETPEMKELRDLREKVYGKYEGEVLVKKGYIDQIKDLDEDSKKKVETIKGLNVTISEYKEYDSWINFLKAIKKLFVREKDKKEGSKSSPE